MSVKKLGKMFRRTPEDAQVSVSGALAMGSHASGAAEDGLDMEQRDPFLN